MRKVSGMLGRVLKYRFYRPSMWFVRIRVSSLVGRRCSLLAVWCTLYMVTDAQMNIYLIIAHSVHVLFLFMNYYQNILVQTIGTEIIWPRETYFSQFGQSTMKFLFLLIVSLHNARYKSGIVVARAYGRSNRIMSVELYQWQNWWIVLYQ